MIDLIYLIEEIIIFNQERQSSLCIIKNFQFAVGRDDSIVCFSNSCSAYGVRSYYDYFLWLFLLLG